MYPFSISTDEHVPLKFTLKKMSEVKSTEFWNYKGRLRFYVSKLICCGCTINVPLQIGKCTPGLEQLGQQNGLSNEHITRTRTGKTIKESLAITGTREGKIWVTCQSKSGRTMEVFFTWNVRTHQSYVIQKQSLPQIWRLHKISDPQALSERLKTRTRKA